MNNYITRDEIRSVIEDKLCAVFSVTSESATNDQIFQASAIVIRELMSRFLAVKKHDDHEKEVHYMSMEFLLGRSLMKNAFNLGVAEALTGALQDMIPPISLKRNRMPASATAVSAVSPPAISKA